MIPQKIKPIERSMFDIQSLTPRRTCITPNCLLAWNLETMLSFVRSSGMILCKGYEYRYVKNKKERMIVVCIDERWKWRVHVSQDRNQTVFQIKTFNGGHSCTSTKANKNVTSAFYTWKYLDVIREDAVISWSQIVSMIRRDTGIKIRRSQGYRMKQKENEIIHGEVGKQYLIIRQYRNGQILFQRSKLCFQNSKNNLVDLAE